MSNAPKLHLDASDVAETLGVNVFTLYRNLDAFPPGVVWRLGRTIRFDRARLAEWLAAGGSLAERSR